jgi:hypothetical protein
VRRALAALATALAATLLTCTGTASLAPALPAGAAAVPEPTVALLEQPAFVRLGDDMAFRLAIDGPTEGLEVRAVIYRYTSSRLTFERTISGDRLGSPIATASAPVATLPVAAEGGRLLTIPLQDPDLPRDPARVRVALPTTVDAGVYPVEVELWNPDRAERVGGFVTHMVAVGSQADGGLPVGARLDVAWVWRIASAPATQPDGKLREGFRRSVAPGGRLARVASALPAARSVPLTLALGPETMAAWRHAAQLDPAAQTGLTALRNAAQTHQVLARPYVPIDGPSLESAGLGGEVPRELAAGRDSLGATLSATVDPRTSDASPVDAASLTRLQREGVARVVVAADSLATAEAADQFTPARPFTLTAGGQSFAAVETNEDLARLLTGAGPPALRAQRFLAGLAVVALEQPNEQRGVAIDSPVGWAPQPTLLAAVLAGLTGNPLLEPTTLDGLFERVPAATGRSGPTVRTLAPVSARPAPVTLAEYLQSRADLDALASMIGAEDPTVDHGRESLLLALSSAPTEAAARRRGHAQLASIETAVRDYASGVHAPQGRTVTLTSPTAEIPVSLLNSTGRAVTVRVRLESPKLRFPDGAERVLTLPPRNTTTRFTVQARTSGTFPLRVVVTSENGGIALQEARYTVRSTVVSGVGVFLTIGAGLFLAIWWVTHWRRSRRRPVTALTR